MFCLRHRFICVIILSVHVFSCICIKLHSKAYVSATIQPYSWYTLWEDASHPMFCSQFSHSLDTSERYLKAELYHMELFRVYR